MSDLPFSSFTFAFVAFLADLYLGLGVFYFVYTFISLLSEQACNGTFHRSLSILANTFTFHVGILEFTTIFILAVTFGFLSWTAKQSLGWISLRLNKYSLYHQIWIYIVLQNIKGYVKEVGFIKLGQGCRSYVFVCGYFVPYLSNCYYISDIFSNITLL